MSKREIKVEVLQCDYEDNDGERCKNEGDREAIKECGVCNRDICITHYELTTVTIQGTRDHFTYYSCGEVRRHKTSTPGWIWDNF